MITNTKHIINKINTEKSNLSTIGTTLIFSASTSFILMFAFANILDQQAFGVYQYIITVASILGATSLTGLTNAIIRAVSRKQYSFLSTAFQYTLYSMVLPILLAGGIATYYLWQANYTLAVGIFFTTIFSSILITQMRYNAVYVGLENFKASSILLRTKVASPFLVLLPALFLFPQPAFLAVVFSASACLGIWFVLYTMQTHNTITLIQDTATSEQDTDSTHKQHLSYAFHQSIINVLTVIGVHADKVIVFQLLGGPATAIYYIAKSLPDRIRDVVKQFDHYLFSKFAKQTSHSIKHSLITKIIFVILVTTPFYVGYIVVAPYFFAMFLPQYTEAISLTLIYAITLFVTANSLPNAALNAHASNQILYKAAITTSLVRISFLFIGTTYFGLKGAVIASTLSVLFVSLTKLFYAYKL